jgi:hypothetical protein
MNTLTLYQIICLLGIPSVGTMIGWLYHKVNTREKIQGKENQALKLGMQALLRSQMINDYNSWMAEGYAPIYAKENFENMWEQYEALGVNGVMNGIHETFMALPTQKPKAKRNSTTNNN